MSDEIKYNIEHLESIEKKYSDGAAKVQQIENKYININNSIHYNYEGQASKEIYESVYATMKDHLALLHACYESLETYVREAKESMQYVDGGASNGIETGAGTGEEP